MEALASPEIDFLPPHQRFAIEQIRDRAALAVHYGTGTGKTVIFIIAAALLHTLHGGRYLILVKNATLEQVYEECERWLPPDLFKRVLCLSSAYTLKQRAALLKYDDQWSIALLSHEALGGRTDKKTGVKHKDVLDALKTITFEAIFLDEASRFRNWTARTRALLALKAKRRYTFTGSPIVKSASDLFYPMTFLDKNWCGITQRHVYDTEFCVLGGYTGTTPIATRPERLEKLNGILDQYRIATTLSQVRDDLPLRLSTTRYVDLHPTQVRAYAELRDTLRLEIARESDASYELSVQSYVARMQKLQEIAAGFTRNQEGEVLYLGASAKTDELLDLLEDKTPTIVWTWWVPEYTLVSMALSKAGVNWVGQGARNQFLDGDADVILMNLASGAWGLNLDRAERMIYHSLTWDLEIMSQSLDRNWRWTTDTDKYVVYLVAANTIDVHVKDRLVDKANDALAISKADALEMLK